MVIESNKIKDANAFFELGQRQRREVLAVRNGSVFLNSNRGRECSLSARVTIENSPITLPVSCAIADNCEPIPLP
ncbi:hypothetical protein HZH66_009651 [Vespula vulgaris]|uniref:Uncharacterized protein n=1 Tax=Vespula vulgaris TaxID=7454 RepID=A0A834JTF4_VESVU|nr:hypothetical protein HZH66_009651 [Vespula vulgaris]